MPLIRTSLVLGAVGVVGLSACGGDDSSSTATTLKPLTSTAYVTTPPVVETTIDPANTVPPEREYTVQAGDYLFGIAQAFGVKAEDIASYNGWTDGIQHPLNPGDVIKIPPGGTTPTTTAGATGATETTAAPATTLPAGSQGTYTVEAGDYLFKIAKKFDTTPEAIAQANGWTDGVNHAIFPGDVITIPAKGQ